MFFNLLIFINFVLISSGKTKFFMASCLFYKTLAAYCRLEVSLSLKECADFDDSSH